MLTDKLYIKEIMMRKALELLKTKKFDKLVLVWSCPATKQMCIRDITTGKTKIIEVK